MNCWKPSSVSRTLNRWAASLTNDRSSNSRKLEISSAFPRVASLLLITEIQCFPSSMDGWHPRCVAHVSCANCIRKHEQEPRKCASDRPECEKEFSGTKGIFPETRTKLRFADEMARATPRRALAARQICPASQPRMRKCLRTQPTRNP